MFMIEAQERLASGLGHRPSLERWADTAGTSLGAQADVGEVNGVGQELLVGGRSDEYQTERSRKEHMIKANLRLESQLRKNIKIVV